MKSMTGYAFEEQTTDNAVVSAEIKSVNSRFLDLTVSVPPYLNQLEGFFRAKVSEAVPRGKVDVFIRIKEFSCEPDISVDEGAARAYATAVKKVMDAAGCVADNGVPDSALNFILSQPGVIVSGRTYDMEKYRALIEPVFAAALSRFVSDTQREGENLRRDLEEKLESLAGCADFFAQWQPQMEDAFKNQITARFRELLGDGADENRIMSETAALLVKYTINEEIVRLKSHISAMRTELAENPAPGKRLDFICQEMNREINTIGSKNQFSEVGAMVINAKDALENIREQAKNIM